jgi:hypothetical protein
MNGRYDREDGLTFTIRIPTEDEWKREVNPPPPPPAPPEIDQVARRQEKITEKLSIFTVEDEAWERGRLNGHQQIDATNATNDEKKRRKARLDAKIAQARDQEGG